MSILQDNYETIYQHLEDLQEVCFELLDSFAPPEDKQNSFFKETKCEEEVEVTDDFQALLERLDDTLEDVEYSLVLIGEDEDDGE